MNREKVATVLRLGFIKRSHVYYYSACDLTWRNVN
jgi:hypothetical protein